MMKREVVEILAEEGVRRHRQHLPCRLLDSVVSRDAEGSCEARPAKGSRKLAQNGRLHEKDDERIKRYNCKNQHALTTTRDLSIVTNLKFVRDVTRLPATRLDS